MKLRLSTGFNTRLARWLLLAAQRLLPKQSCVRQLASIELSSLLAPPQVESAITSRSTPGVTEVPSNSVTDDTKVS